MRNRCERLRAVAGATMAAGLIALSLVPLGATAMARSETSAESSQAKGKQPKISGCDPSGKTTTRTGVNEVCVATEVEAWYQTTPASELPPDVPVNELPEESQYPANTLHVGQRLGQEESRTYLTFDLSAIPITATITEAVVYLPLDEDGGTNASKEASFQACLVNEPPDKSKQGSFDPPPEAECSETLSSRSALLNQKPRPHFELNLGEMTDLLTPTVGVALLPNKIETQQTRTWHLAFFSRDNKDADAEPISTRISYREAETPTFGAPPSDPLGGSGSVPLDSGGGFVAPPSISGGGVPGTIDSVTGSDSVPSGVSQEPVETGADQPVLAIAPTAIRNDPQAYSVKWLVPLALLFGAVFWSFVLNQEIKLPRR